MNFILKKPNHPRIEKQTLFTKKKPTSAKKQTSPRNLLSQNFTTRRPYSSIGFSKTKPVQPDLKKQTIKKQLHDLTKFQSAKYTRQEVISATQHYKTESHMLTEAELGVISEVEEAIPLCPLTERKKRIGEVQAQTNSGPRYDHEMMMDAQATFGNEWNETKFRTQLTDADLTLAMYNFKQQPQYPQHEPAWTIIQTEKMLPPQNSWLLSGMAKHSQNEMEHTSRLGTTLSDESVTATDRHIKYKCCDL